MVGISPANLQLQIKVQNTESPVNSAKCPLGRGPLENNLASAASSLFMVSFTCPNGSVIEIKKKMHNDALFAQASVNVMTIK